MKKRKTNERRQRRLPARPVEGSATRPYRILDISKSGCSVESSRPLGAVDSSVSLELPVPGKVDKAVLRATIVWKGDKGTGEETTYYRYGLHFQEADAGSHQTLDRYLDFLRRDLHLSRLDGAWKKIKSSGPK